jgi:hypothetical protein
MPLEGGREMNGTRMRTVMSDMVEVIFVAREERIVHSVSLSLNGGLPWAVGNFVSTILYFLTETLD